MIDKKKRKPGTIPEIDILKLNTRDIQKMLYQGSTISKKAWTRDRQKKQIIIDIDYTKYCIP